MDDVVSYGCGGIGDNDSGRAQPRTGINEVVAERNARGTPDLDSGNKIAAVSAVDLAAAHRTASAGEGNADTVGPFAAVDNGISNVDACVGGVHSVAGAELPRSDVGTLYGNRTTGDGQANAVFAPGSSVHPDGLELHAT